MLLLTTTDGKDLNIETAQYGDRLQVFQPSEKEFAIGDSVVFTKNDKALNVQNGLTGVIKGIDDNLNISIETKGGRMVDIDSQQYQYMDHAYASTDFKSQGASYRNVIFTGESERANSN
jgi:ATP-dependent exoDNAse (exonuclease V) alpha subunit